MFFQSRNFPVGIDLLLMKKHSVANNAKIQNKILITGSTHNQSIKTFHSSLHTTSLFFKTKKVILSRALKSGLTLQSTHVCYFNIPLSLYSPVNLSKDD